MRRAAPEGRGDRGPTLAVASLYAILGVTVCWWALALWPAADVPPSWLLRARQVCFDAGPSGLPGPSGWLLLVGQPIGMFALLMVIAGDGVGVGLRRAWDRSWGKVALGSAVAVSLIGLCLAAVRVSGSLVEDVSWTEVASEAVPRSYPRLDRAPPALGLVDQKGDTVHWERFEGRPTLVTFGFGHCATVCPLTVRNALRVQESLRDEGLSVPVVVVTLDPWRDTPARLPHLAEQFEVAEYGFVLSGSVEEVNRVLDGLEVARERDPSTGDIVHPSLVYLMDGEGRIAYGATGHVPLIQELMGRL